MADFLTVRQHSKYALKFYQFTPPVGVNVPDAAGYFDFHCNNPFIPLGLYCVQATQGVSAYLTLGDLYVWKKDDKPFHAPFTPINYLSVSMRSALNLLSNPHVDIAAMHVPSGAHKITKTIDDAWLNRTSVFVYLERIID